jgi:hypothetical protein
VVQVPTALTFSDMTSRTRSVARGNDGSYDVCGRAGDGGVVCLASAFHSWEIHICRCSSSTILSETSSSHGGEYGAQNLLTCTAVFLIGCRPTLRAVSLMMEAARTS